MSDKDRSSPAFPAQDSFNNYLGMTLRDYFAAQALPAVIAAYIECNGRVIGTDHLPSNCTIITYRIADAMLEARKA